MKFSIVIPVYKTPRDLFEECIESVLAWKNEDLEVILVIDSPGHEIEKDVYEVAARDSRVKVLRNEKNMGPSYSRNRGIDAAQGDYVMMVDADDRIVPKVCEKALKECIDHDLDYCAVARVYPWQQDGVDCFETEKLYTGSFDKNELLIDVLKRLDMSSSGVWYRRVFLIDNNIRYPEDIRQCEDFTFTTSIVASGAKVGCWDEYGYVIVPHWDSLSNQQGLEDFYLPQLKSAQKIIELIRDFSLSDSVLKFYAEHGYNQIFSTWHKVLFKSISERRDVIRAFVEIADNYGKTYCRILSPLACIMIWLVTRIPMLQFSRLQLSRYAFRFIRKFAMYYA